MRMGKEKGERRIEKQEVARMTDLPAVRLDNLETSTVDNI